MDDLKNIVESLLFMADGPLPADRIKEVIPGAKTAEIRKVVDKLMTEYAARNGGFILHEVAGGFQFRTRPEYKEYIRALYQPGPARLSKAAMETLAIVAYQQPVLRSEIEHIRGVGSGNTLRFLLDRKLIRVLGRRDVPGRPLVYGTTRKFLETFDLRDLKDLPAPDEIEPPSSTDTENTESPGWESGNLPLHDPADTMKPDVEKGEEDADVDRGGIDDENNA